MNSKITNKARKSLKNITNTIKTTTNRLSQKLDAKFIDFKNKIGYMPKDQRQFQFNLQTQIALENKRRSENTTKVTITHIKKEIINNEDQTTIKNPTQALEKLKTNDNLNTTLLKTESFLKDQFLNTETAEPKDTVNHENNFLTIVNDYNVSNTTDDSKKSDKTIINFTQSEPSEKQKNNNNLTVKLDQKAHRDLQNKKTTTKLYRKLPIKQNPEPIKLDITDVKFVINNWNSSLKEVYSKKFTEMNASDLQALQTNTMTQAAYETKWAAIYNEVMELDALFENKTRMEETATVKAIYSGTGNEPKTFTISREAILRGLLMRTDIIDLLVNGQLNIKALMQLVEDLFRLLQKTTLQNPSPTTVDEKKKYGELIERIQKEITEKQNNTLKEEQLTRLIKTTSLLTTICGKL